jgi:hypothetical protein
LCETIKLVSNGIDTLILNVRYADSNWCPVKQELDEGLAQQLEALQAQARLREEAVESPWVFLGVPLFVEPHGAGKQWRWRLTCRLLKIAISRGRFNNIIAQVRFSSEFLWSQEWCGDALSEVYSFLITIFGEYIHLQLSEIHLCADVVGYDFSQCDYERCFVTRVRKNEAIYGVDGVALDCHRVSTLAFSQHKAPLSCSTYNKRLEIVQKSGKTWFFDLWRSNGWDGEADVWRVEFRFKREVLHEFQIEWAYDVLSEMKRLWDYAAGRAGGGDDGLPDGWLRYVVPTEDDSNRSRWPVHPAWVVVQSAFADLPENELGLLVRKRIREKNVERGLASTIGYLSTLAAWLGGEYASDDTDVSLMLHWLAEHGPEYLDAKEREFVQEVRKKQKRYGNTVPDDEHGAA